MAIYRINISNAVFRGSVGDLVVTEPGPFMDAAVRSGVVTRQMDEPQSRVEVDSVVDMLDVPPPKRSRRDRKDTQAGDQTIR